MGLYRNSKGNGGGGWLGRFVLFWCVGLCVGLHVEDAGDSDWLLRNVGEVKFIDGSGADILVGSYLGMVGAIDKETGALLWRRSSGEDESLEFFAPSGDSFLFTAFSNKHPKSSEGSVRLFSQTDGALLWEVPFLHNSKETSFALGPDHSVLVVTAESTMSVSSEGEVTTLERGDGKSTLAASVVGGHPVIAKHPGTSQEIELIGLPHLGGGSGGGERFSTSIVSKVPTDGEIEQEHFDPPYMGPQGVAVGQTLAWLSGPRKVLLARLSGDKDKIAYFDMRIPEKSKKRIEIDRFASLSLEKPGQKDLISVRTLMPNDEDEDSYDGVRDGRAFSYLLCSKPDAQGRKLFGKNRIEGDWAFSRVAGSPDRLVGARVSATGLEIGLFPVLPPSEDGCVDFGGESKPESLAKRVFLEGPFRVERRKVKAVRTLNAQASELVLVFGDLTVWAVEVTFGSEGQGGEVKVKWVRDESLAYVEKSAFLEFSFKEGGKGGAAASGFTQQPRGAFRLLLHYLSTGGLGFLADLSSLGMGAERVLRAFLMNLAGAGVRFGRKMASKFSGLIHGGPSADGQKALRENLIELQWRAGTEGRPGVSEILESYMEEKDAYGTSRLGNRVLLILAACPAKLYGLHGPTARFLWTNSVDRPIDGSSWSPICPPSSSTWREKGRGADGGGGPLQVSEAGGKKERAPHEFQMLQVVARLRHRLGVVFTSREGRHQYLQWFDGLTGATHLDSPRPLAVTTERHWDVISFPLHALLRQELHARAAEAVAAEMREDPLWCIQKGEKGKTARFVETYMSTTDLAWSDIARLAGHQVHLEVDSEKSTITGFRAIESTSGRRGDIAAVPAWQVDFGAALEEIAVVSPSLNSQYDAVPVHVKGDSSILHKYQHRNILAVVTFSTNSGDGRRATVYALNGATGEVIASEALPAGTKGPVLAAVCENWIALHYWSEESLRHELYIMELFEDKKDEGPLAILFPSSSGRHEDSHLHATGQTLSAPLVRSRSFVFPTAATALGVTATRKGITTRSLIMNEGLPVYMPLMPVITTQMVSYFHQVERVRAIATAATERESTSVVVAIGQDIFFAPVQPSKGYDTMTPGFDYSFLSVAVLFFAAAVGVTAHLASRQRLYTKWK
uniref:ER membrane protein complex subunit 1 n=1 Tax=Chromera velia CCMP2878 TaxID=1169474 RepID=A0A0G4I1I4_9ALVE|eukprot:Cvel_10145.t1-p1 / transcript=Cvel_10145.t1 / gene=Cvel_10145 / organism=Chromera_velia_CCMP2878 / gene_product=ER membrane protein complex subunit 1, putative / transcript_product=ER membrane protein complex subunit 1, putative / location=Cvel_scaffold605:23407-31230(+) / protein_length=1130 / sequence_SO=supercontig / SO=protein_coding / is_pseudo=false